MLFLKNEHTPHPRLQHAVLRLNSAIPKQFVPSRLQYTQQVTNIESMHLFACHNSRKIPQLRPSSLYDNPQASRVRWSVRDMGSEKQKQESRIQTVSIKSASSSIRKNTFLTVVSRLPQCKKRSGSVR